MCIESCIKCFRVNKNIMDLVYQKLDLLCRIYCQASTSLTTTPDLIITFSARIGNILKDYIKLPLRHMKKPYTCR